eukprot:1164305-Prymnesium_polylepis.1
MFGPGRAYVARGSGARRTTSSSASVHAVARITADSAKMMAAETAAAWWPYSYRVPRGLRPHKQESMRVCTALAVVPRTAFTVVPPPTRSPLPACSAVAGRTDNFGACRRQSDGRADAHSCGSRQTHDTPRDGR